MKKAEKIRIVCSLIERTGNLAYAHNAQPQIPVLLDAFSFVGNAFEGKKATRWETNIKSIYWGVSSAKYLETEQKRTRSWHNGKSKFLQLLNSIKWEIEQFSPDDSESTSSADNTDNSTPVIFLSHSSSDKSYGDALANFITGLGVKREQLIYTSHPLHKIPFDADIYEYLRKNIYREIFMIFLWSDKYLDSPACMNEMGAAWVTQSDYSHIFTPKFSFGNPKFHECAVVTRKMGAVLNGDEHCKTSMIELKNKIVSQLDLPDDEIQSSHLIDKFIEEITSIV